jgi:hypothetical protein
VFVGCGKVILLNLDLSCGYVLIGFQNVFNMVILPNINFTTSFIHVVGT